MSKKKLIFNSVKEWIKKNKDNELTDEEIDEFLFLISFFSGLICGITISLFLYFIPF